MQQQQDLAALVQSVKQGDTSSFQILYDRTVQMVYRTVCFLSENRRDAEDIVQEIYLELYRNIHKYDDSRPFPTWLYGFVLKQVSANRRKSWRFFRTQHKVQVQAGHFHVPDIAEETVDKLRNEQLIALIEHLPFKYKQILVLHYLHDFSLTEIADILNIPSGTVKSRLHVALAKLRRNRSVSNFIIGRKVENSQ